MVPPSETAVPTKLPLAVTLYEMVSPACLVEPGIMAVQSPETDPIGPDNRMADESRFRMAEATPSLLWIWAVTVTSSPKHGSEFDGITDWIPN